MRVLMLSNVPMRCCDGWATGAESRRSTRQALPWRGTKACCDEGYDRTKLNIYPAPYATPYQIRQAACNGVTAVHYHNDIFVYYCHYHLTDIGGARSGIEFRQIQGRSGKTDCQGREIISSDAPKGE